MQMQERLVKLFDYPIAELLAVLPDASAPIWNLDTYRQDRHEVHRQTRSIIFE